ncbi:MAG: hypothetical protein NZV14_07545 [Bryobacteraceae bacterium]|nr:hypothetical protein [Bryobacteraceae bacterium]MDW8377999.1 hypothetical protein [Bryobacterales bacterium]
MGAELTWVALAASLFMGLGGACLFIYAVKKDYFRNLEEAKYHVFWSDLEELVDRSVEQEDEGIERGSTT